MLAFCTKFLPENGSPGTALYYLTEDQFFFNNAAVGISEHTSHFLLILIYYKTRPSIAMNPLQSSSLQTHLAHCVNHFLKRV